MSKEELSFSHCEAKGCKKGNTGARLPGQQHLLLDPFTPKVSYGNT